MTKLEELEAEFKRVMAESFPQYGVYVNDAPRAREFNCIWLDAPGGMLNVQFVVPINTAESPDTDIIALAARLAHIVDISFQNKIRGEDDVQPISG